MKQLARALLALVVGAAVGSMVLDRALRLEPGPALPGNVRRHAMARMRAALQGSAPPAAPRDAAMRRQLPAPIVVSVFQAGQQRIRVFAGGRLDQAIDRAARAIVERARGQGLDATARLRIEVPTARAPLFDQPTLLALSLVAGQDGIGATVRGETAVVTSWDLIGRHLYDQNWVVDASLELEMAASIEQALSLLAGDLEMDEERFAKSDRTLFRFRADTIVEGAPGELQAPRNVTRLSRALLRDAALQAAHWCEAVLGESGKYRYLYDPLKGREDPGARYSLPRHCGTTYYLSQAYRHTKAPGLEEPARRALDWLVRHTLRRCGPGPRRCVRDNDTASLGSAALGAVAMAEYRHATSDPRYDEAMRSLGQFIRDMQKPNGDFHHRYSQQDKEVKPGQLLYYTGEATLALLKLHEELGDPRDLAAARKALDFLTGPGWDFFFAPYYFSEEHWTCIAANEAYPRIKERRYLDFCDRFARFRRNAQYRRGETAFDAAGGYGFGTFVAPHTTPAASTTEAMVSTALLHRKWGHRSAEIERQVFAAVRFLLRRQLGPEHDHLFPDPRRARGGFPSSEVNLTIRIDYTQHAGSAILRSAELL